MLYKRNLMFHKMLLRLCDVPGCKDTENRELTEHSCYTHRRRKCDDPICEERSSISPQTGHEVEHQTEMCNLK